MIGLNLNHYETVLKQFQASRDKHPESDGRKVPKDTSELPLGGIRAVKAAVLVFDIADSKKASSSLGKFKFTEWIGLALHLFFHCVDDYDGLVDKYTGDGAMVSFSLGSSAERCQNARNCALKISEILNKILNPLYKSNNYRTMNLRIGIDFGQIRIERIGKRVSTHLIIIGGAANYAKDIEQFAKNINYSQNTAICMGYDVLYNIPVNERKFKDGTYKYYRITTFSGQSEMDKTKPYPIYQYNGRYFDD